MSNIEKIKNWLKEPLYHHYDKYFVRDKYLVKRNKILKNRHKGKRGFVIASGDSISQIDLNLLSNEITFGIGFMFAHPLINSLNLNYFYSTEPGPALDNPTHWTEHDWPKSLDCKSKVGKGKLYLNFVRDELLNNGVQIFLDHNKINYYKENDLFDILNSNIFFLSSYNGLHIKNSPNIELTSRFIGGGGSIYNTILIMIYMGFSEIFLIGAGYTYNPRYEMHFYNNYRFNKSMGNKKAHDIAVSTAKDHNCMHGSDIYLYSLIEKDNYYHPIYISDYEEDQNANKHSILNNLANNKGVKIYNIVPEGFSSPIYSQVTWEYLKKII
jgi:hypothetical protein